MQIIRNCDRILRDAIVVIFTITFTIIVAI